MVYKKQKFRYRKSHKIVNWGYSFDSLLELKYAISIMEDYEFLRGRVAIYYDPVTRKPTDYIRQNHRRYTPDFLIRHKETGAAYLVEIKPRAYQYESQLILRKEVAENYILWKKYDWKYKIIFDDQIILDAEQLEEYELGRKLKSKSAWKIWFQQYNMRFDRSAPTLIKNKELNSKAEFVMLGTRNNNACFR